MPVNIFGNLTHKTVFFLFFFRQKAILDPQTSVLAIFKPNYFGFIKPSIHLFLLKVWYLFPVFFFFASKYSQPIHWRVLSKVALGEMRRLISIIKALLHYLLFIALRSFILLAGKLPVMYRLIYCGNSLMYFVAPEAFL